MLSKLNYALRFTLFLLLLFIPSSLSLSLYLSFSKNLSLSLFLSKSLLSKISVSLVSGAFQINPSMQFNFLLSLLQLRIIIFFLSFSLPCLSSPFSIFRSFSPYFSLFVFSFLTYLLFSFSLSALSVSLVVIFFLCSIHFFFLSFSSFFSLFFPSIKAISLWQCPPPPPPGQAASAAAAVAPV